MYVDGVGELALADSGGFPVVWIGGAYPIGQDPNQGGTNVYGPGDVLFDGSGAAYQIGGDWHVYPMGGGGGGASAPSVTDHFYYVDSGRIIEKTAYSDGQVAYADTGMASGLGDGAAAGDPWSLNVFPQPVADAGGSYQPSAYQDPDPNAYNPAPVQDTSGGFYVANWFGGYGPYATADPPQLSDAGTYADGGRLIHKQVDQYGNPYYTDVGPASSSSSPAPTASRPSIPAPTVGGPSVPTGPSIYNQAPAAAPRATQTPYPTNQVTGTEPRAADGQALSQQGGLTRAIFQARYGDAAADAWVAQHNQAIGAAPAATGTRPPNATGAATGPSGTTGQTGGRVTGNTPAITATGNPSQFASQVIAWLGRSDFIAGVPNGALVGGGYVGYRMYSQRRRR